MMTMIVMMLNLKKSAMAMGRVMAIGIALRKVIVLEILRSIAQAIEREIYRSIAQAIEREIYRLIAKIMARVIGQIVQEMKREMALKIAMA